MAGWTLIPASSGDICTDDMINEVRNAINERWWIMFGRSCTELSAYASGDIVGGDDSNTDSVEELQQRIEELVAGKTGWFGNWEVGCGAFENTVTEEVWFLDDDEGTANNIFRQALGATITDWSIIPTVSWGNADSGHHLYANHFNEMRLVLNKLTRFRDGYLIYGFPYGLGGGGQHGEANDNFVYDSYWTKEENEIDGLWDQDGLDTLWASRVAKAPAQTGAGAFDGVGVAISWSGVDDEWTHEGSRDIYITDLGDRLNSSGATCSVVDIEWDCWYRTGQVYNTKKDGWEDHTIELYHHGSTDPAWAEAGTKEDDETSDNIYTNQVGRFSISQNLATSGLTYYMLKTTTDMTKPALGDFETEVGPPATAVLSKNTEFYLRYITVDITFVFKA